MYDIKFFHIFTQSTFRQKVHALMALQNTAGDM